MDRSVQGCEDVTKRRGYIAVGQSHRNGQRFKPTRTAMNTCAPPLTLTLPLVLELESMDDRSHPVRRTHRSGSGMGPACCVEWEERTVRIWGSCWLGGTGDGVDSSLAGVLDGKPPINCRQGSLVGRADRSKPNVSAPRADGQLEPRLSPHLLVGEPLECTRRAH